MLPGDGAEGPERTSPTCFNVAIATRCVSFYYGFRFLLDFYMMNYEQMYRGFNQTDRKPAYTTSPSIPTKYQSVVIANEEKKGFSSQTRRFPSLACLNENPVPCSCRLILSAEVESPSFSKKGTSSFVKSKTAWMSGKRLEDLPSPNAYNLQRSFINENNFGIGASRVFRSPVAVQLEGPKHRSPGPNQYDVSGRRRKSFSTVDGTSTFLSKTGRDSIYRKKNGPSPCHYVLSSHLIEHGSTAVVSPFKSTTPRVPPPIDYHVPGPGAYSPHQTPAPPKRTRRGYYLEIADLPLIVPKDPPLPGPGQYDVAGYNGLAKQPKPTAAFASRTGRIPQNSPKLKTPGPGYYNPRLLKKQSFFCNGNRIWVPV